MVQKNLYRLCLSALFLLAMITSAQAGPPTEKIKETTDKILKIVTDPKMKVSAMAGERKKMIRKAVDERFDWEEMAQRALATHWAKRTSQEKSEFVIVFGNLLERTYLDKVEGYSGEKVTYADEVIEGEYGDVKVKIVTSKEVEIPVHYRLKHKGNDWLVYDISIEGVSLVRNYRVQFNDIILQSSYQNLMKRLKDKVAGE